MKRLIGLLLVLTGLVMAATRTWSAVEPLPWDAGLAWSGGAVPGPQDTAEFDATSNQTCTIDSAITCGAVLISAGSGTITMSAGSLGCNSFIMSGGTRTFTQAYPLNVAGPVLITAGTLTSTAAVAMSASGNLSN